MATDPLTTLEAAETVVEERRETDLAIALVTLMHELASAEQTPMAFYEHRARMRIRAIERFEVRCADAELSFSNQYADAQNDYIAALAALRVD